DLQEARRVALALAQAGGQRLGAEAVDLAQERMVRATGELRTIEIAEPQREQRRFLELGGKIPFLARLLASRQFARHADHLEAAILEVVRFLGVEREDLERQRFVRRDQRRDLLEPEHFRRGEAMAAVRRPQSAVGAAHDDQRIEERSALLDL